MKEITLGILAHVDSGKTTLSEAMLYNSGKIRSLGRVDHKNTFLDTHTLEKNRGITIFSKQAIFSTEKTKINLLDTPGHADFSAEAERVLQVLDYAVLVINATDGVQSHTITLWNLLSRHKVPTFIFVNKMDLPDNDMNEILGKLKLGLNSACTDFSNIESNYEDIALCSDELMEDFIENETIDSSLIAKMILNRKLFPCVFGSALKLDGIDKLLDVIDTYTVKKKYENKFAARVFKITWDEKGNRLSHMKITGGSLKVKAVVFARDKNGKDWSDKVNEIRLYSGKNYETSSEVLAGEVCAVTGLSSTYVGQALGEEKADVSAVLEPVLSYKVNTLSKVDVNTLLTSFRVLEEEDPQLRVVWDEKVSELHIRLMGVVQIEVLSGIIKERFGFEVEFDSGSIVYKETIKDEVTGSGHFEPLKHYAEVHLKLEPLKRGSGLIFDSTVRVNVLGENYRNLVLSHLAEKTHTGVLTNSPITDMKVTLISGRAHIKHTEGGDFRQATFRALRQALLKSESVLLEPFYNMRLEIPNENVGRALNDIRLMGGECDSPEMNSDFTLIKATVPVSTSREYQREVSSYTKGIGKVAFSFKGYEVCHNEAEIIEEIAYDYHTDSENTGDSVFCSHGTGFIVKWDDSDDYMHIKLPKKKTEEEILEARIRPTSIKDISENELMEIFERTYGPIKRNPIVSMKKTVNKVEVNQRKNVKPVKLQREYILVDGYNIIFSWDKLKKLAADDIDAARFKLMDMLCNFCACKSCELILVFDAYKVKGGTRHIEKYHNISVVYTKEAETADMYIERTTHEAAKNHRVRVATSDGLQQMIILGHGALRVSAKTFEKEVEDAEKEIREILESKYVR